jgi:sorbitol-specific phosphotransferase system component IIBC
MLISLICDVSGSCHVFNLLYAAPGDWMGAVLLVQILRVTFIPAVTGTAVHFLTMRRCALTQQHTTCNTSRIQPSGTTRLANVICASILRLCGIYPAIKSFSSSRRKLLV